MATVNIGAANADDAFYRYKMPKLEVRTVSRGNGVKTSIVNNVNIAKALGRPPEFLVKYFGYELGALTTFDKATGVSIVNGQHSAEKLSQVLEGFIKTYVQCSSCGNPETTIKTKKDRVRMKCKACGFVTEVDPRCKLNAFILKSVPPEPKKKRAPMVKPVVEGDDDDGVVWMADTSLEAVQRRAETRGTVRL